MRRAPPSRLTATNESRGASAFASRRPCGRPFLLPGRGVRRSRASAELRAVAELLGAPVATTPVAKGVSPETDSRSLQVFGFAGSPAADRAMFDDETDCVLVVASGLSEL